MPTLPTGYVTFLFTDIEGSLAAWQRFPGAMPVADCWHTDIVSAVVRSHGGHPFKYMGDQCCTAFADPSAALAAALAAQRALGEAPWHELAPGFTPLRVRMAIHSGPVRKEHGDYKGLTLGVVARVMDLAAGGQVLLTETTRARLGPLPPDAVLRDLHPQHLAGVMEPVRIHQVLAPGLSDAVPPDVPWDPGRIIAVTSHDVPFVDDGALRRAVVEAARGAGHAGMSRGQLRRLSALAPTNDTDYWIGRIATWCDNRFKLDTRFVRMTLRLGRVGGDVEANQAPRQYSDLRATLADRDEAALVVVGPPGAGKSTLLRRLELDLAVDGLNERGAAVPFFLPLNSYGTDEPEPWVWIEARWATRYPGFAPLAELAAQGRVVLLLDALNEMPHEDETTYRALVGRWRHFVSTTLTDLPGNRAVFSCRTLDYSLPLSSSREAQVPQLMLEPLDDDQVRAFLHVYCRYCADDAWQALAGTPVLELVRLPYFLELLAEQVEQDGQVPEGRAALFTSFVRRALGREVERDNPAFAPGDVLSLRDYKRVVQAVHWPTPHALPAEGPLVPGLADLAYGMQHSHLASEAMQVRVAHDEALPLIGGQKPQAVLAAGLDLGVLDEDTSTDDVLFRHQLLQEYFAARRVARATQPALARSPWRADEIRPSLAETLAALAPPDPLPPPPATGWEETMVLAASMATDPVSFVEQLAAENLPLAGRCAAQPEVHLPEEVKNRLRWSLVARSRDPGADLRARIQAGLALGNLGDPRFERRVGPYGEYLLPPFVEVPGGVYTIGSDEGIFDEEAPAHQVTLAPFKIAQFPVTNAEWALFMKAGGYEDERWWNTEDGRRWRRGEGTARGSRWNRAIIRRQFLDQPAVLRRKYERGEMDATAFEYWQRAVSLDDDEFARWIAQEVPDTIERRPRYWHDATFAHPGKPVVGISWYEARAYCDWLSAQTGWPIMLPSEAQREAATRGPDGWRFAYGSAFDADRCNTFEAHVRQTTPIGVWPRGDTPAGLTDMTGNVSDWTSTRYGVEATELTFSYPYHPCDGRENAEDTAGSLIVARGGGWGFDHDEARAACRYWNPPSARFDLIGLRLSTQV